MGLRHGILELQDVSFVALLHLYRNKNLIEQLLKPQIMSLPSGIGRRGKIVRYLW